VLKYPGETRAVELRKQN